MRLFVEFVLRADRLYHFMPTQSWLCLSDITGQLVSVRNMIPDVHGEAPVIEGNSMHLERAWTSIHNLAGASPSEGFSALITAHSSKLNPIGN